MSLSNLLKEKKKKVDDYFAPVADKVRVRDVARELPGTIGDMFSGTKSVVTKAPKIIGEGLAYATSKNVRDQYKAGNLDILPTISSTTPRKMLADTAKSVLEIAPVGKIKATARFLAAPSLSKRLAGGAGLGYAYDVADRMSKDERVTKDTLKPGMGTVAGGALSGLMRPTAQVVKQGVDDAVSFGTKAVNLAKQDIRTLKNPAPVVKKVEYLKDGKWQTVTDVKNEVSRRLFPGDEKVFEHDAQELARINTRNKPARVVETVLPKKYGFANFLKESIPQPGLSIKDVSKKKSAEIIARKNARAREIVEKQRQLQRSGAQTAEEGFVSPQSVKAPQNVKSSVSERVFGLSESKFTPYKKQAVTVAQAQPQAVETARKSFNLDISGYRHEVDNYALRHALAEHGADELPLKKDDFKLIGEILRNPDEVIAQGKTKQGLDVLRYKKRFNGTTFYVEEIRTGKNTLNMKTMYKVKTPVNGTSNAVEQPSSIRQPQEGATMPSTGVSKEVASGGAIKPSSLMQSPPAEALPEGISGVGTTPSAASLAEKTVKVKAPESPMEKFSRELDSTPTPWKKDIQKHTDGTPFSAEEQRLFEEASKPLPPLKPGEVNLDQVAEAADAARGMESVGEIMRNRSKTSAVQRQQSPVAEYNKLVNGRPVPPQPKTIGGIYDTFVNTEANRKAAKKSAGESVMSEFKQIPEGVSQVMYHEPTVLNYDTWLRAIGMKKAQREKVSFTEAKQIIHDWRVKNQPEYTTKQAEISHYKNFVGEFQNALTEGVRRGKAYLERFGSLGSDIIRYLDQPGAVPEEVAPAVNAIRGEQDALFREARDAGLDVAYWKNYITHVWQEGPEEVAKKIRKGLEKGIITMDDISTGRGDGFTKTQFFDPSKSRLLKTYEAGEKIGLHPLYNDPAQILAHYVVQLERAKVIVRNIASLKERGMVTEGIQPGMKALNIQGAEGLSAVPELADKLNNAFGANEYTTIGGKILEKASATSRKLKDLLMSGGIPASTVNSYGISMTLKEIGTLSPTRAWNAVSSWVVANAPGSSRKFFEDNLGQIEKIRRNDIQISTMLDNGGFVDHGWLKNILGDGKGKGFWGGAQAHWDAIVNEPTFGRYLPMNQIKFFNSIEERLLKKGYPAQAAEWIAAKELREGFGLGSASKEAGKSRVWKDWRETAFFAPTHRMNMIRVFGNALKALGRNPFTPGNQSAAQFLVGGIAVYAAYDWVNYKNTGHHLWDNPEGKKFEAYIKLDDGEYISVPYMPSVATMPRLGVDVAERVYGGDVTGALGRAWQGTGSILSKPIADVAMNSDYFDRPIANERDETGKQWMDRAKYLGKSYTGHPWIKAGIDAASGTPAIQVAAQAVEAPVRFTTEDKLASRNFWDAYMPAKKAYETFTNLVKTDPERAKEYAREHREELRQYDALNPVSNMYSDMKKRGEQDQFGSVLKNIGFAFDQGGEKADIQLAVSDVSGGANKYMNRAQQDKARLDFDMSGENFRVSGNSVFRRNPDGTVKTERLDTFNSQLNSAKLSRYKKNENLKEWRKTAGEQLDLLNRMMMDPSIDELEKIQIQNQAETLIDQYQKYAAYGGFTKPKKKKVEPMSVSEKYFFDTIVPKSRTFRIPKITQAGSVQSKKYRFSKPKFNWQKVRV